MTTALQSISAFGVLIGIVFSMKRTLGISMLVFAVSLSWRFFP